ncbi:MAG: hypothetical protein AAGE92_12215, partial [Cyanobacteria bacterium P01_G01_bin.4]
APPIGREFNLYRTIDVCPFWVGLVLVFAFVVYWFGTPVPVVLRMTTHSDGSRIGSEMCCHTFGDRLAISPQLTTGNSTGFC